MELTSSLSKRRRLVVLFFLVAFAFFLEAMLRSSFNSIFHLLQSRFSDPQIGVLASGFFFAYAVMQLFVGYFLDRYSVRKVIFCGLFVVLLGVILKFSNSFYVFLGGRILSGIGSSGIFLSGTYFIQSSFPRDKAAFLTGLYISIGFLGGFAANLPFLELVNAVGLWGSWLVCAVFCMLLLLGVALFWPEEKPVSARKVITNPERAESSSFLKSSLIAVIFLGFSAALIDIVTGVFGGLWGGNFLQKAKGLSESEAVFISSLTFIGYMIGSPFFGRLYSRVKNIFVYIPFISLAIALGFYVLIYRVNDVWSIGVVVFILGFLAGQNIFAFRLPFLMSQKHSGMYLAVANFIVMSVTAVCDIAVPSINQAVGSVSLSTSFFIVAAIVSSGFAMCAACKTRLRNLS